MKNDIKSKAKEFLRKYKLSEVTLADLLKIISSMGYTLVEYNNIYNDSTVSALIDSLGVEQMTQKSKGFTFADRLRRVVFLNEDLSDDEKVLVLAHEVGHIYCNHFSNSPIIGRDVIEEHEANEFSHYILNVSKSRKISLFMKKKRKFLIISLTVLIATAAALTVFFSVSSNQKYYGEYYITSTGKKYHKNECIFIKDKTNTHRITVEEFESGEYEPCDICLPLG